MRLKLIRACIFFFFFNEDFLFQTQTLVTDYNYIITVYNYYNYIVAVFIFSQYQSLIHYKKNRSTCIDYANKVIRLIKDN